MKGTMKILISMLAFVFVLGLSFQVMAGMYEHGQEEAVTLADQITNNGMLITDRGKEFGLSGDMSEEFRTITGQRVEITGTVMEEEGQKVIQIQQYKKHEGMPEIALHIRFP